MAEIHQFPTLDEQEQSRRILRNIMMDRWCRAPLGEWDVPAVSNYIVDKLLEAGWQITRI